MNIVCLMIDRLHAGYLGAYGNTWIDTPALDQLAFESFVADQFLIDSPCLEPLYRSLWHGQHALAADRPLDARSALPEVLTAAGIHSALLTDAPAIARHACARGFVESITIPSVSSVSISPHGMAEQYDQTHLARSFAKAVDWLAGARSPFFLWCHFAGLAGPWDAPREFRHRYVEPEDPPPPDGSEVPCRMLEANYDPDELLGACQSYAGQITLLDMCLGALFEFLDGHPAGQETLVMLASARGLPLGEHRRLGPFAHPTHGEALYGELVHAPLMLRFPDRLGAATRSQALIHPADLWATLLDWRGRPDPSRFPAASSLMPLIRGEVESVRDRLCVVQSDHHWAIRTPAWYLRQAERTELFAKPDDRWEVNDVADRCADIVERLQEAFGQYRTALLTDQLADLATLEEILVTGIG